VFDKDRLDYLNGVYIRNLTDEQLALRLRPFVPEALEDRDLLAVVPLIKERLVRLSDAAEMVAFLTETDVEVAAHYLPDDLVPKQKDSTATAVALSRAREVLDAVPADDFAAGELDAHCRAAAEALGWKAGDFFMPIRLALTGRSVSPPLFGSMELLGRERCLARLDAALVKLTAQLART
jgi:glutamyl-tRNA synthetase